MSNEPGRSPSLASRAARRILLGLHYRKDWQIEGHRPQCDKFVLVGAPHTSNWDFVFFLGLAQELGIEPSFMGKQSLFRWPVTNFMLDMGGVPVDRGRRGNYVEEVARAFASADKLALAVAPEGSRRSEGGWRSGFYHIAMAAKVPIVPGWVDYETSRGGVGEPLMPSGDYRADLATLARFYRSRMPDCERFIALEKSTQTVAQLSKGDRGETTDPRTPA